MLRTRKKNNLGVYTHDDQVVSVVFGGQAGSEGKGAIVGFMARRHSYDAAICSFMTNAGHTWVDGDRKVVVQQLPISLVNREIPHLLIGPGAAITVSQLEKELNELDKEWNVVARLGIHPRAMIINEQDALHEKHFLTHLGSTQKGCGAALARKAMRYENNKLARDIPSLYPFLKDTTLMVSQIIENGGSVMVEGSQGFDLDINHGIEYPYCTSRGTTPMQTLADCGIPGSDATDIISVLRTYPIRVGHIFNDRGEQVGNSGPFGGKELTWDDITWRSGSKVPLKEITTVTKRVRRVFEMDFERLLTMKRVCDPTAIALTFVDYLDAAFYGWTQQDWANWHNAKGGTFNGPGGEMPGEIGRFAANLDNSLNMIRRNASPTMFYKTGPDDKHTITLDPRFMNLWCD